MARRFKRFRPGKDRSDFDYVVVGAGTAGSIVASRLSEDPDVRVLVVEAGPIDRKLGIHLPPGFIRLFKTDLDWAYETEPEPECDGRRLFWPRGKVVGGSGSLNAQLYVRGHRRDYDRWRDDYGCAGWGYDDVLPYFKKSEGFEDEQVLEAEADFHGTDGPWTVQRRGYVNAQTERFLAACGELGWRANPDFNGARQEGYGLFHVSQKGGKRWSTARAFLHPALERPNLALWVGATTTRVLVEGGRARGIEVLCRGKTHRIDAAREVVLCGGAINTPQLLLLSGIGPADALRGHGIDVVHDAPEVGVGLQDHLVVSTVFRSKEDAGLDHVENLWNLARWLLFKTGPLLSTVCEAGAFLRLAEGAPQPDLQIHFLPAAIIDHGFDEAADHGFNIAPTLLKPQSRGQVSLASADPLAAARIEARYLSEPADLDLLVRGVELVREVARTQAFADQLDHGVLPPDDVTDRAGIEAFVRATAATIYHPTSTARMGGDPASSVVDPTLRVHGVDALRVADASVMPEVPGGNTNAPSAMVAEKAADLIRG